MADTSQPEQPANSDNTSKTKRKHGDILAVGGAGLTVLAADTTNGEQRLNIDPIIQAPKRAA